ncbi:MAG: trimethylamine methyltransferase family protein [Alphaproteobacteria bacterium]|nr:trimethylamine methyltransferase family protein [Alphaproteobacteria bacterium]
MARYEIAFYQPMLPDWCNFESGAEYGARSATERATAFWKNLLGSYQEPPIDPGVKEAIDAYVRQRNETIADGRVSP